MSLFKKFFNKKKDIERVDGMPETNEVTLNKIFNVASLVPIEYKHTAKFIADGEDPLAYERQRLQNLPADWLMKDKRVPAIQADTRREIEIAKRQFINHIYTIETIQNLQDGILAHVDELIDRLDEEIEGYDEEIRAYAERAEKK